MKFTQFATLLATLVLAVNSLPTSQDEDHIGLTARADSGSGTTLAKKESAKGPVCGNVTCNVGDTCVGDGRGNLSCAKVTVNEG
ncbi:hypothetical protein PgNI_10102 [Pyricularia grisea]|uniref:Uncharacterized protein n=1 Tax=Pyricularia grisea TaxID=148305 RepID=A0A6P8AX89_PYRGI|nr:hypothetical protein PgNI_10102 [Pyricularia grisea]TLD06963.1 hypothetical protein PgNI_10102 [Pyricularia grisea]